MACELALQLTTSYPLNNFNSKQLVIGLSQDWKPVVAVRSSKKCGIYLNEEEWLTLQKKKTIIEEFFNKKYECCPEEIHLQNSIIFFEKFTHKTIVLTAKPSWLEELLTYKPTQINLLKKEYFTLANRFEVVSKQFDYLKKIVERCVET